ncbi:MAG: YvcK family protein [bacterium]|nr:YvcK family protein [bacterium]
MVDQKIEPRIVAIGGGTGLPGVLEGLKNYTNHLTAIVTVTDSGRSSGALRKDLGIPPPGDIRNCLIALSESEELMLKLFKYRFEKSDNLRGHNFGNLFIAAMTMITGSFEKAIEETSKILKIKGRVIPSSLQNVHICAELIDGTILSEEDNIIQREKNVLDRSPIKRVYLEPAQTYATSSAIEEIRQADLIILGPGSLYTSIISNLLVKGIPEAIRESKALKVYVSNVMTQVSQTHNYKAGDHIKAINQYLGEGTLDYIIVNGKRPPEAIIKNYEDEFAFLVEIDEDKLDQYGIKVIKTDLIEDVQEKRKLWKKQDSLRHDSQKLGKVLLGILDNRGQKTEDRLNLTSVF